MSENFIQDKEFDIYNKKQRLESLKKQTKKSKYQYTYRKLGQWRSSIRSSLGKKKGKYLIDRKAEEAIYQWLAEHAKAHHRRHGELNTWYLDEGRQRLQNREMRMIANEVFQKLNCHLIKSKETVRAFGKPRNKRSIQAKQHRGRWLSAFSKSEKKLPCRYLNVHYNRAFVKNYTWLLFKRDSPYLNRGLRIACDDKAYLRCGTSEGFSRPVHKPLHLSTDDMKFQLPAADYPKSCGYVSPGVIITVNKMDHVDHHEDDKYTPADVTVSVTCKPKAIYSSDSTNWANDIYAHRINFREEHELPISLEQELLFKSVPENLTKTIIFVRDSLLQFEIMSIEDDFIRLKEGGDHLEREMLRLSTLAERVNLLLHFKGEPHCSIIENTFCVDFIKIKNLKQKLDDLVSIISSNVTLSDQIKNKFI